MTHKYMAEGILPPNAKVLFPNPAELGNTWEIAELLGLDMPRVEYVHRPNHR